MCSFDGTRLMHGENDSQFSVDKSVYFSERLPHGCSYPPNSESSITRIIFVTRAGPTFVSEVLCRTELL